jgi:Flp pilus assembly protein protease CpaA
MNIMNNLFITNLINPQNMFLIVLGLVWILVAIFQDLRKREVANWVNFSLLIFALGYRLFYSLFSWNFDFFLFGLFGVGVFFVLGNLFYYSRLFAGGDAKLLISLGAILPLANTFKENIMVFFVFVVLLVFLGAMYSLIYSIFIAFFNKNKFKTELIKNIKKNRILILIPVIFAIFFFLFSFFLKDLFFIFLGILFFMFGFFYVYGKTLEEIMVKEVNVNELTEGDWLYKDIVLGKGKNKVKIKSSLGGLEKQEINKIKKYLKKVKIKQGIPYTPAFLFAFFGLFLLWDSSWHMINLFFRTLF